MRQISCLGTPLNSWSAGDNSSLAMAWWTDRNDETHLHWTGDGLGYGKGDFEGGGGGCAVVAAPPLPDATSSPKP